MWSEIVGPLVGGAIAFAGVVSTQGLSWYRDRQGRTHTHLLRVIDKRYDLYMEYLDVLSTNADIFMGADLTDADPNELVRRLAPLERSMQVFASNNVLGAFETYRSCMRKLTQWADLSPEQRAALQHEEQVVSTISLAAVREDLMIDSFERRFARRRQQRRVIKKLLNRARAAGDAEASGSSEAVDS